MRHMGDRLHFAADGDIRRVGRETDTTAGGMDVQTVNTVIGRARDILRQTPEHRLVFVVIQTVYAERVTPDINEDDVVKTERGFYFEVLVNFINTHGGVPRISKYDVGAIHSSPAHSVWKHP